MTDMEKLALHIGKIMAQLDRIEDRLRHVLDHLYRVEDDVKNIRYPTQAFGGAMWYGPEDAVRIPEPKPAPVDPADPQAQRTDRA